MRTYSLRTFEGGVFWITFFMLLSAIILTLLSSFDLCTSACVEGQNWRLLGYKFESFGMLIFPLILFFHTFSLYSPLCRIFASLIIASALGAELWFIIIQKTMIGNFCPICISIAFCLFVAGIAYIVRFFKDLRNEEFMYSWIKIFPTTATFVLGFLFAVFTATKINPLEEKQLSIKENISFGKTKSPIEVYVFTDWFCPACRKTDPEIDKMMPDVQNKAKVYFIDAEVHPESLNFTPYNLSFMINNKENYLQIRKALENLAEKNKSPSDADIRDSVKPLGVTLKELNYSDIALGVKLFKKLVKQFEVTQTPTVVIVNLNTKKGKKFSGAKEINRDNVLRAIDSLQ